MALLRAGQVRAESAVGEVLTTEGSQVGATGSRGHRASPSSDCGEWERISSE